MIRVRMGVIEIGRKSDGWLGALIFGILVQVEVMTGDDEGQLSCAEKIQTRAQYESSRNDNI